MHKHFEKYKIQFDNSRLLIDSKIISIQFYLEPTDKDFTEQPKSYGKNMEDLTRKEFQNSLDLTSEDLEGFIPDLLKGLWELGSMPTYIIELIDRNSIGNRKNIIDLGCGKGAVLIKLAQKFDIKAIGVDVVQSFINEASNYAVNYLVADKVEFKTENILETVKKPFKVDIVIYGYDSEILGDLKNTVQQLAKIIKEDGYILLEYMLSDKPDDEFLSNKEMQNIIEQSGFQLLDRIDWDGELLKQTNKQNTEIIERNVNHLISKYPDKKKLFNQYLQNQIEECKELENDYFCTTVLLRHKNYCA
jgi:cyclopropane fatty-acyl-phospholipid synthase-like methyltransferase